MLRPHQLETAPYARLRSVAMQTSVLWISLNSMNMIRNQLQLHGRETAQAEPETGDVSKTGS